MKMMKYFGACLAFIALWMPATGNTACLPDFDVEVKASAFFPYSKTVRQISANVIPFYELEIAKPFCNRWKAWLSAGYLRFEGHSICCKNDTEFCLVPVTLGLKYYYPVTCCLDIYAGLGACWSFLNNHDFSSFVHRHIKNNALGGMAELGFSFHLKKGFFIDFYAQYLFQKFNFNYTYADHYTERHNVNMSGLKTGLGIGFEF